MERQTRSSSCSSSSKWPCACAHLWHALQRGAVC
jgi:hypothetical protein